MDFHLIFRAHFQFLGLCSEFCGAHFDFSVKYEAMDDFATYFFPEGTTANGASLNYFQAVAFLPLLPVQPVIIRQRCWQDKFLGHDQDRGSGWAAWAYDTNLLSLILYHLCAPFHSVTVEFLPVYEPDEGERVSAGLYAGNVRKFMGKYPGILTSKCNRYDGLVVAEMSRRKNYWSKFGECDGYAVC